MQEHAQTDAVTPEPSTAPAAETAAALLEAGNANGNGNGNGRAARRQQTCTEQILNALIAFRNGGFSTRLPVQWTGVYGKIADVFNEILAFSERRANEMARISRMVGKEGKLQQRMAVPGVTGGWVDEIQALNTLIADLARPTTEVTRAIGAVAKGDLGQSIVLEVDGRPLEGEFLRSANLVNGMIEQLSVFTSEVTRVAREVGTAGKLGGQARSKACPAYGGN